MKTICCPLDRFRNLRPNRHHTRPQPSFTFDFASRLRGLFSNRNDAFPRVQLQIPGGSPQPPPMWMKQKKQKRLWMGVFCTSSVFYTCLRSAFPIKVKMVGRHTFLSALYTAFPCFLISSWYIPNLNPTGFLSRILSPYYAKIERKYPKKRISLPINLA